MPTPHDIPPQSSPFSIKHRAARVAWSMVWKLLFRPSPTPLWGWRRMLLRLFGARIHPTCHVYESTRVWAPWNLTLGAYSGVGRHTDIYAVAPITIGARTTISQYTYLCGAGHDFTKPDYPLTPGAITIGDDCWLAADVYVGPGVNIGSGTVVGARSSVFNDLPPWSVAVGTPAKVIKPRVLDGRSPGAMPQG